MGRRVRYLRRLDALGIEGSGVVERYSGDWFKAPLSVIGDASLASLHTALVDAVDIDEELIRELEAAALPLPNSASIDMTDDSEGPTDLVEAASLVLAAHGDLELHIHCFAHLESMAPPPSLEETIEQFSEYRGWKLKEIWKYDDGDYVVHVAKLIGPLRGVTVRDAHLVGVDLVKLCESLGDEVLDKGRVVALLEVGRADVLLGQYESVWLECKRVSYDLGDPASKIELAQDVARFANGEFGGVLVCGIATKKDAHGDRLHSLHPLVGRVSAARYHRALDQMIYPSIQGLRVHTVPASPTSSVGTLLVIDIPPQPEEAKPFLVTGAIVRGRVEGAFISIVRRRGEHSIPVTAAAIHASLAAGRALLRSGQLPSDE